MFYYLLDDEISSQNTISDDKEIQDLEHQILDSEELASLSDSPMPGYITREDIKQVERATQEREDAKDKADDTFDERVENAPSVEEKKKDQDQDESQPDATAQAAPEQGGQMYASSLTFKELKQANETLISQIRFTPELKEYGTGVYASGKTSTDAAGTEDAGDVAIIDNEISPDKVSEEFGSQEYDERIRERVTRGDTTGSDLGSQGGDAGNMGDDAGGDMGDMEMGGEDPNAQAPAPQARIKLAELLTNHLNESSILKLSLGQESWQESAKLSSENLDLILDRIDDSKEYNYHCLGGRQALIYALSNRSKIMKYLQFKAKSGALNGAHRFNQLEADFLKPAIMSDLTHELLGLHQLCNVNPPLKSHEDAIMSRDLREAIRNLKSLGMKLNINTATLDTSIMNKLVEHKNMDEMGYTPEKVKEITLNFLKVMEVASNYTKSFKSKYEELMSDIRAQNCYNRDKVRVLTTRASQSTYNLLDNRLMKQALRLDAVCQLRHALNIGLAISSREVLKLLSACEA